MSGSNAEEYETGNRASAFGGMVPEGVSATHVKNEYIAFCMSAFLLRKKGKVADEKGDGATASDRMCAGDMVSL